MTESRPRDILRRLRLSTTVLLRFLVSLALALLVWGWVTTQQDPVTTRAFGDLALEEPTLDGELEVTPVDLGTVTVSLEGPRSRVDDIETGDLHPRLDLSEVQEPGDYRLSVLLDPPPGTRVARIQPRQIPVYVDEPEVRTFPLEPAVVQPSDGSRRIGTPQLDAVDVTVDGPRRYVDQIARVVLPIEIGGRTDDFTAPFTPVAHDAGGAEIQNVTIVPETVQAMVPVVATGRSVPVLIQTAGNPAEGYEVVDNAANPSTVLLDGPEDALAQIVSVSTEPVSIEGATEQVTQRVGLARLPPNVRVVEPPSGQVYAVVQVRQRGTTQQLVDLPVAVSDLGPGLEATVEPATLDVIVFANDETLSDLRGGDVEPTVSVEGRGPGTYVLTPIVAVPPALQWVRSEPETVRVVIRETDATPSASPTRQWP